MEHNHERGHGHNLKLYLSLYLLGIITYIISFFTSGLIQLIMYFLTLSLSGFHVIGEGLKDTVVESIRHKRFKPNIHLLMTLGAVGAIIIKDYHEAVILILIFAGAHFLEDYAEGHSKREIEKLMNLNVQSARLLNSNGEVTLVEATSLKIGDKVLVLEGDEIPSDGIIIDGTSDIIEANITGESVPKTKTVGDLVFGSTINGDSSLVVEINKNVEDTLVAKIIKMVSETQTNLSKTAQLIKKIEPIYVTIVLLLAPLFYLFTRYLLDLSSYEAFYRTMVFLIATSPCALAVTDIPASLSAISNLAKNKILFKGGSYLESFANIETIAFDKTGTLTTGNFSVTNYHVFLGNETEVLSLIYAMEKSSNHPIAKAILTNFNNDLNINVETKNITGIGIETTYLNKQYLLGKPSSHNNINKDVEQLIENYTTEGKTVILLSSNNNIIALLAFLDVPTKSAHLAIEYFNSQNIKTVMITGDTNKTAEKIASQLNINTVYANVLPTDKANIVNTLQENDTVVAFLGDGINDAPALATSNVGIAMGDGTDVAIDVADAVVLNNNLEQLIYTHKVAKRLKRNVIQNIFFAMGVVLFLVIFNILGLMQMQIAVILHEGSTLVVILSGLRMLIQKKNG